MYHCYNPKRLGRLLLLDGIAIILVLFLSHLGKLVFSAEIPKNSVFLPIVMYHSVTPDTYSAYQVTQTQLRNDLRYLSEHGYETVSAAQLIAYANGKGSLPEHPVMLTFDDGFYNNLSLAHPLLEEFDMCAVVSVVGQFTQELAPEDSHADAYSYLTWEDINALLQSGRVEIGSHTYDLHSMDTRAGCSIRYGEDAAAYTKLLRDDLSQLQGLMQEETGIMPIAFAYPFGYICKESIPVLRELGFQCTFTCYERPNYITREPNCLFGLDRYNRSGDVETEAFFERVLAQEG